MAKTNSNLTQFLQPLTKAIDSDLIPALTGQSAPGETMTKVFVLPTRRGGLGIIDPLSLHREFTYSLKVAEPLTKLILQQQYQVTEKVLQQQSVLKASVKRQKNLVISVTDDEVPANLNINLKRAVDLAKEKGASVWLTALPIEEHSLLLTKSEFHDALCLRYGWRPKFLPDFCPCGDHFSVDHSLSCPTGGFPTLRHIETRDIVANLLDDVCHDVKKEPILQKLTGKILPQKSNRLMMKPGWTSPRAVSAVVDFRKHTLMLESLILMLSHIDHQQYHLCTGNKSKKRNVNTRLESEESNKLFSHY